MQIQGTHNHQVFGLDCSNLGRGQSVGVCRGQGSYLPSQERHHLVRAQGRESGRAEADDLRGGEGLDLGGQGCRNLAGGQGLDIRGGDRH